MHTGEIYNKVSHVSVLSLSKNGGGSKTNYESHKFANTHGGELQKLLTLILFLNESLNNTYCLMTSPSDE